MARDPAASRAKRAASSREMPRRDFVTLAPLALGAGAVLAQAGATRSAAGAAAAPAKGTESDGSELTAHRQAYYARARF